MMPLFCVSFLPLAPRDDIPEEAESFRGGTPGNVDGAARNADAIGIGPVHGGWTGVDGGWRMRCSFESSSLPGARHSDGAIIRGIDEDAPSESRAPSKDHGVDGRRGAVRAVCEVCATPSSTSSPPRSGGEEGDPRAAWGR